MSSTIKLYEHNQKTYDALLDMLGERDRACIIKPTGTGKFVIIAKMVQDNPDKRFLLLGYNVGFDLGFLSAVGVRPREDARITDTMNLFTWFMGRRYKLVDAADHIGYEWTGRAHGSLADALATLAVQRWLEQWLVAE